jgi:hypothetical protein
MRSLAKSSIVGLENPFSEVGGMGFETGTLSPLFSLMDFRNYGKKCQNLAKKTISLAKY